MYRLDRSSLRMTAAALAALALAAVPAPWLGAAHAQQSVVDALPAEAVCLVGKYTDAPNNPQSRRGKLYRIVVHAEDAAYFTSLGFDVGDCTQGDLRSRQGREDWRGKMCALARFGNEAVQDQLEAAYGVRPAVLCASAERVAALEALPVAGE